jgi:methyl-accepting chemotaxis protein
VHEAETLVKEANDDRLMKDILMLRRREKDFMQRLDIKYLSKFDKDFAVFKQDLAQSDLSSARQQAISQAMDRYQIDFHALVAEYEVKGLSSKEGIHGDMRKTIHQSEEMLSHLLESTYEAIENTANQASLIATLFSLFVGLIILSGMAVIGMGISRNLRYLHDTMIKACDDQDLSLRAPLRGNDEVTDMGRSFNTMMESFAKLLGEMQISSEQLSAAAEELNMITQDTTDGIMRQNTETDQVATAMNEMNMTVQEVARNAGDAAAASQQAQDVANTGKDVVAKNMSSIQGLANEINSTAELMNELNQESENIGTVLNVIRGIAEQTNLLALNAAIEAARAGEQGRGFAVVADEVRALAQRSQQSTMEIEEIVERLQSRANTAMNAMNHGQAQAGDSVTHAEEAGASLDTILTSITAINDMNLQIASAAEEQTAAAEEINRNVVNISKIAQESSNSTEQTTQTSQLLAELSAQLQEMVSRFRVN